MWRFIVFLILLVISVWLGVEIVRHPGFMFIVFQSWTVQIPIWFAILSFLLLLGILYLIFSSFDKLRFLWFRFKNWLVFRREQQSFSKTQQGLAQLIEGDWKEAERSLLVGMNQSIEPFINYLAAARAAHEQKAYDRRDRYIQKAYQVAPQADLAIGLVQAELELEQNQLEHAVATLQHLKNRSPYHPRVLKLLEKIYVRLGDFQHLQRLIPNLRKANVITRQQAEQFERNIYLELLNATRIKTIPELEAVWEPIPRVYKKQAVLIAAYVKRLMAFNGDNVAINQKVEKLIEKTLSYQWEPELVPIYGSLMLPDPNRQLVIMGAWLKVYGEKPALLFSLGKLCARLQLWGKAKDYFEKCLKQQPNAACAFEYGKLLERLGEEEHAKNVYKEALMDANLNYGNRSQLCESQTKGVFNLTDIDL